MTEYQIPSVEVYEEGIEIKSGSAGSIKECREQFVEETPLTEEHFQTAEGIAYDTIPEKLEEKKAEGIALGMISIPAAQAEYAARTLTDLGYEVEEDHWLHFFEFYADSDSWDSFLGKLPEADRNRDLAIETDSVNEILDQYQKIEERLEEDKNSGEKPGIIQRYKNILVDTLF